MRFIALLLICKIVWISSTATSCAESSQWVLVLHGGAGFLPADVADEVRKDYETGLREAMEVGVRKLEAGDSATDVVIEVVASLEDNPVFNAGKGAVFTAAGTHELDACLMEGSTLRSGAVTGVKRVKNPIRAARLVMDETRHLLLAGAGADKFAIASGCKQVDQSYFFTAGRFHSLNRYLHNQGKPELDSPGYPLPHAVPDEAASADEAGNTVGCVVLDAHGVLAAATSTGGLSGKMHGRVGDTPIVGAGTYANAFCGVSGTGVGEQYMRHTLARRVAWQVEQGETPAQAVEHCLTKVIQPGEGGLIAIDAQGQVTAQTNTGSMPHAIADSNGRREVGIWIEPSKASD